MLIFVSSEAHWNQREHVEMVVYCIAWLETESYQKESDFARSHSGFCCPSYPCRLSSVACLPPVRLKYETFQSAINNERQASPLVDTHRLCFENRMSFVWGPWKHVKKLWMLEVKQSRHIYGMCLASALVGNVTCSCVGERYEEQTCEVCRCICPLLHKSVYEC